jgi:hypothetical protein
MAQCLNRVRYLEMPWFDQSPDLDKVKYNIAFLFLFLNVYNETTEH